MKKLVMILVSVLSLVFTSTIFAYSHVLWLSTIEHSDFHNVTGKVYIDPALNKSEYELTLSVINEGKERIHNTYGSFTANPVIVIIGTPENAEKYGLGLFPGKAFAAPWEEYIVVKHQAHDVNLLAHELMHSQTREILGYWAYQTKIPTWLDEGIAMQVDYRNRYNIDYSSFNKQEISRVKKLNSPSNFWTNSKEQDIKNYRAAKAAVHEILTKHSPQNLYSLLQRTKNDEEFNEFL